MTFTWKSEWPHWALLVLLLVVLTLSPNQDVPIHWGLSGGPDRFADKWIAFAGIAVLYVLLAVLPRFDPGGANYRQFAGAYRLIRLAILAVVVALTGSAALGLQSAGLPHLAVGALLMVVGSVMGKIRPNWFVGIRTSWTLSSKRSWLKTHRLGGWLLGAWGFAELLVGLVFPTAGTVTLVGVGLIVVILLVYSYLVWRDDPDKLPAVGTRPAA